MVPRTRGESMRQAIVALAVTVALVGAWAGLLNYHGQPRHVEAIAAASGDAVAHDPVIAEYLRHRAEGHLAGRYH
jgi:hypothetical protein